MFQTTNQNRLIYSIHDKQILRDTQTLGFRNPHKNTSGILLLFVTISLS